MRCRWYYTCDDRLCCKKGGVVAGRRRLPPGSESGLPPPEQRHARANVRSHHDPRLTAANSLARQTPRVFPGRGGRRPRGRSRLSTLRSAEDDPVGKVEKECILVEDRKRMQRMGGVGVPVLEDEVFPMGILLLVVFHLGRIVSEPVEDLEQLKISGPPPLVDRAVTGGDQDRHAAVPKRGLLADVFSDAGVELRQGHERIHAGVVEDTMIRRATYEHVSLCREVDDLLAVREFEHRLPDRLAVPGKDRAKLGPDIE